MTSYEELLHWNRMAEKEAIRAEKAEAEVKQYKQHVKEEMLRCREYMELFNEAEKVRAETELENQWLRWFIDEMHDEGVDWESEFNAYRNDKNENR